MTPENLMRDLRKRINPKYSQLVGSESYERKQCADTIELLIAERDALKARLDSGIKVRAARSLIYEGYACESNIDSFYFNAILIPSGGVTL